MPSDVFPLLDFPDEILLIIGDHLASERDLNAFHQTNKRLYRILNGYLYRSNALHHEGHALFWAISHDEPATARKSVLAGTSCKGSATWPFNWTSGRFSRHHTHTKALASPTGWIEEPFFVACRHRKPIVVKSLLELGAHSDHQPERMLYLAAAFGWPEIVKALLEHGVSVDPGYVETTPLTLAIMNDQAEVADIFFRQGADFEPRCWQSEQLPLQSASGSGYTRMALVS